MRKEVEKQIEEIITQMHCPKDFKCSKSGFENLCEAKDFGLENYLQCLEDDSSGCKFSFPFGDDYICECPLRVYVLKNLGK